MHTMFDFLTHTKGMSYVVAFGFLLLFIPFWRFLTERDQRPGP